MTEQTSATNEAALNAGDVAAVRRAAREFFDVCKYEEALALCRKAEDLDIRDEETAQLVSEIVIVHSREQAGMQRNGTLVRRLKPRPATTQQPVIRPPAANGGPSITVIQQLEASIRDRPSIGELYLQLAQAYLDKDREYDAERLLSKGRELTDHDPRVHAMWEEVAMLRHSRRVEGAELEVKANDNPQTRQGLVDAKRDRAKAELDIFRSRVRRKDANAAAHYGLGICLQRAERTRDACEHLEKALSDADMRAPAALALGHCLKQLDDLPGALNYFRMAVDAAIWTDQEQCRNEALAEASKLAAQMKLTKLSERYANAASK